MSWQFIFSFIKYIHVLSTTKQLFICMTHIGILFLCVLFTIYALHFPVVSYTIMILLSYVTCLKTPESCISRSHNNKDV